jgi:hypothetical protein
MQPERSKVSNKQSPNANFPFKGSNMTFTFEATREEMRGHVSAIVELAPGGSRKAAIAWAARALAHPFARVRCLYYGNARRIDAHEADKIRAYVEQAQDLIDARGEYEKRRQDFLAAHPRLARLVPGPLERTEVSQVARGFLAVANGTAEHIGHPDAREPGQ